MTVLERDQMLVVQSVLSAGACDPFQKAVNLFWNALG